MNHHKYFVYIVTNASNNVLYVGITNDLQRRIREHKRKIHDGFTSKYECNKLVYFEEYNQVQDAINREKQLKSGNRAKKIALIVTDNSNWKDLSDGWYEHEI
jgi:putative endonuclease